MPLSRPVKLLVTNINRIYVEEISKRNSSTKQKREPYKEKNSVQTFNFKIEKNEIRKEFLKTMKKLVSLFPLQIFEIRKQIKK